jgi:hypothetical protein
MLSLDDNRWNSLAGGYRMKCDPRPLLAELESEQNRETAWHELWEELNHQGDVGEASYASVPHLVRIHRKSGIVDWNTYAIVAVIELARGKGNNPEVPPRFGVPKNLKQSEPYSASLPLPRAFGLTGDFS